MTRNIVLKFSRFSRYYAPRPLAVQRRWERSTVEHLDNEEVVIFVSYAPGGSLRKFTRAYLSALRSEGFFVILVVVVDDLDTMIDRSTCAGADAILVRANSGFDFAAWATVLRLVPSVWDARLLVFANDSVFGPLQSFPDLVQRLRDSTCDVVGLTESRVRRRHFQSYFFALKNDGLRSKAMRRFWRSVRNLPTKRDVIRAYELRLLALAQRAGLRCEALYPVEEAMLTKQSPVHYYWRKLIDAGFPFLKIDLLREGCYDTTDWPEFLAARGIGDLGPIVEHLESVAPKCDALREYRKFRG